MDESLQGATFHVEHIVPRVSGGVSTQENLAWACPRCNLQKRDRVDATDPATGQVVPLFNPRRDRWPEHFQWNGFVLVAMTDVGRATIEALDLNSTRRLRVRKAEQFFALFPPADK